MAVYVLVVYITVALCRFIQTTESQYLDVTDIRLVNGSGPFGGRVELNVNGIWGTLCDDNFDMKDATVMCNMMNLKATTYITGGYYGQGTGPIYAQQFNCNGGESSVRYCRYQTNAECDHTRDVAIICTVCGEIKTSYGRAKISADGQTLTNNCDKGFTQTAISNTSVCVNGSWTVDHLMCAALEITSVRLGGGYGWTQGKMEMLVNGIWGTMCNNSNPHNTMTVFCRMLGYTGSSTGYSSQRAYRPSDGPVHIKNVDCEGTEQHIYECSYEVTNTCSVFQPVTATCRVSKWNVSDVRLNGGVIPYSGRVEFLVDGTWGTVCHSIYPLYPNGYHFAKTICRMMNLSLTTIYDTPVYGPGQYPVLFSNIRCGENDGHINECTYDTSPCSNNYDLTLICTPCGIPPNINETTIVFNGRGNMSASCFSGFLPAQITLSCQEDHTWNGRCKPVFTYPLPITGIRLQDTYSYAIPSEGLVRLQLNGTWGGVCTNNFDEKDARVICTMLGMSYLSYTLGDGGNFAGQYGFDRAPVFIDNLICTGTETHVNQCTYEVDNNCTYWNDVAVTCTGYQLNITDLRLSGTNSTFSGRVEVLVNGTWGTVCDDYFSWNEAEVVCNMLGFGSRYKYHPSAYYGQGSGPIFIDRLDCTYSSYKDLKYCRYATDNYYSCTHAEDVSVVCYGPHLNITGARLVNGSGPNNGRAEISVDGVWGTICDQNFDILAADLFCQMFHLRAAQYYTGATHGPGSGPVYIEQIFCQTYHRELSDCAYLHLNTCNHERDVSIVCSACGQPDLSSWDVDYFQYNGSELYADCSYYKTYVGILRMKCNNSTGEWFTEGQCTEYSYPLDVEDIRLAGGTNTSSGRVEVKSLGTWGTVCSNSFGLLEANTVCRMIGFSPAVSFSTYDMFGPGSGPIFVDDLSCPENASHINNCTYNTHDNCQHTDDIVVTCTDCGSPVPPNGNSNTTSSNVGSVARVSCDRDYRMTGDDVITCLASGKWSGNVPSCVYIDCGESRPENGLSNTTATSNGTVANIICVQGYELIGDSIIVCQENDSWTDYPKCNIKDCGVPEPVNAATKLPSNKTTYGEQAVITCRQGFSPEGSTTVECQADGTWEQWQTCEIVDCEDPTPVKGMVNSTTTTYGSVVEVSCIAGYNLTGPNPIVCQADGSWSGSPKCDTSDCGIYPLPNGDVDTSNGTSVGAAATASCDKGYNLNGSSILVCTALGWNDTLSCQRQDCKDPTPENGRRTDGVGTLFGDTASLACDEGYELNGDQIISCQDGGTWSDNTTCVLRDCGAIDIFPNGVVYDAQGTKYGATLKFQCLSGYLLVGSSNIRCESTGSWSDNIPLCIRKSEVGGGCQGDEYCLSSGAFCKNSVCTCFTGFHDNRTKTCDAMPLLPYGLDEDDKVVPKPSTCAAPTKFSPGIPFFKKKHTNVIVCANGYVTFDTPYTNPTPPKNRKETIAISQSEILAPFYASIDIPNSGPVYYRTYDILNSYHRMKKDAQLISYVEDAVMKFGDVSGFKTSFLLVATWTDTACTTNSLYGGIQKTATFQVVVVSDGRTTYAFNIYGQGQMQWADDSNLSNKHCENVFVGYAVDSNVFTHPLSFSIQSLKLDQRIDSEVSSEYDVAGLIFKSMTSPSYVHKNDAVDCIKWYNDNQEERNHLDYLASLMPECPCDIWLSQYDPWFWRIGLQRGRTDVKYACVDMLPTGNFKQYGKSCCYDLRTWSWVYERPLAGGFKLYHPQKYPAENFVNDVLPKNNCCVFSDHCNLYYRLRPSGSCYQRSPYNFGRFWGDPHFYTLDGLNFTFNGLGEFTMLQIRTQNMTFDLQARTERAVKQDGNLSDATVFSAFAAKDSANASVHVELNKAKTGLNVFVNNLDVTSQFNADTAEDSAAIFSDDNIYLAKRDGSLISTFSLSGISLNVSVSVGMLSLSTIVPNKWQNTTGNLRGLLGNFDGNPMNDFMLPNGTVLPANMTERQIFDYGLEWSINGSNSAFVYAEGKNHSYHHNLSYVPRFLDEVDAAKRQEAETLCGSPENMECIFDFVFTELKEVAEATATLRKETDSDQQQLDTAVPKLIGCNTTKVTLGETVNCSIELDDGDNIEFIENNVDAKFDRESLLVTYVQSTDSPVDIRIISKNDINRTSPVFQLNVALCTGCNGHGNCTQEIRQDKRSTEFFQYFVCECEQEYEGDDCEKEFDGCAATPCSLGRNCTKLSAEQQKLLGQAYKCSSCPSGYQDNGNDCIDVDECNGTHSCGHNCTNTDGGYVCTCINGFRLDANDAQTCRDINECEESLHNCSQLCKNTVGGFECDCHTGYQFNETAWTCMEKEGTACNATSAQRCNKTKGCTLNTTGEPVCFCGDGFELDKSGIECRDVDECESHICSHLCNNTVGGFKCSCYQGYRLVGLTACQECEIPFWGMNCENKCSCTGRGANSCDPVRGCVCLSGWQGASCDEDINECDVIDDACKDPRRKCVNTLGSYVCNCISGYTEANGTCADINECSTPNLNNCNQTCSNTIGGYTCGCYSGFIYNGTHLCKDVDECSLGTHKCQQRCVNSPGSYSCFCHFGYTLNDDRHTCEKQEDPCLTEKNLTCAHYCLLKENSASCRCYDGFALGEDNQTCVDVNECSSSNLNQCDEVARCENTEGSYLCFCPSGYKLENDGRTCKECDSFHFGVNCSQSCNCVHGTCDKTKGCQCKVGWAGDQCDQDLDECSSGDLTCSGTNVVCVNTLGSAKCSCRPGYANNSGICKDINECADPDKNICDHICNNTDGSYRCECYSGFKLNEESKCSDVNECAGSHGCSQNCENTVGSYRCSCFNGYKLNLVDRRTCIPENECSEAEASACGNHSSCTNSSGAPICSCIKGFSNISGMGCHDVDECLSSQSPCSQKCNNTAGSFICSCKLGFYLRDDMTTCQECSAWKFGINCQSACSCNETNTESCNSSSGSCICKAGWKGATCNQDVDECLNNSSCPNNSDCDNTEGGYSCTCHVGYFRSGSGLCEECDSRHFGERCTKICTCDVQNTLDCNNVNGTCACKQGWTGENCTEDVEECTDGACQEKINSNCVNTVGSYVCPCNKGFIESQGACEDIDECGLETTGCSQLCNNTDGGYFCSCVSGYTLSSDNRTCDDTDECAEGTGGCSQKCNNTIGSYYCSCYSGFILAEEDNKTCDDINECLEDTDDCLQLCNNTEGSFTCGCEAGYFLDTDDKTCTECSNWNYGIDCAHNCTCNQTYTETCNKTTGECHCTSGWKGSTCSDDINECDNDVCPDNSTCSNMAGSYNCECNTGYSKSLDGTTCEACQLWRYGLNCSESCVCNITNSEMCNHVTGACTCQQGWEGGDCNNDTDECLNGGICEGTPNSTCVNTDGSFDCQCNEGYRKEGIECTICEKWQYGEDCALNCSCNQTFTESCDPVFGDCTCTTGWEGDTCDSDVNECNTEKRCPANSSCVNTDGSFMCPCDVGFLKSANDQCQQCQLWNYGINCSQNCTCNITNSEMCSHVIGHCTCMQGWEGTDCNTDVNECSNTSICDGIPDSTCVNTNGSFDCQCNAGYTKDGTACSKCQLWNYGLNCSQHCSCNITNTEMCNHVSGDCTCKEGWNGTDCNADINECSNGSICNGTPDSTCVNTDGSFYCECNAGYTKEGTACSKCHLWDYGLNCSQNCSCNITNSEMCNHISGDCTCKQGWEGEDCSADVNECANASICDGTPDSSCVNTNGSFDCQCKVGYTKEETACSECQLWNYGINCSQNCSCNITNSVMCNHISGECTCKQGWEGTNCSADVNECSNDSICDGTPDSTCVNTDGSFDCQCNVGYTKDGSACSKCTGNRHGVNCSLECSCNETNAASPEQTCNAINGICECNKYWTGTTCDDDVNECKTPSMCNNSNNEVCVNTVGSFNCDCLRGYTKGFDGVCDKVIQTTTQSTADSLKINLTVTIDYDLPEGTNLNSSKTYEETKATVTASLTEFYRSFTNDAVTVIVLDIREGSLIVDYIVKLTKNEEMIAQLVDATSALAKGALLMIGGQNFTVKAEAFSGLGPCDMYDATIGKCDGAYRCVIENNKAYCRMKDDSENWAAILGGTAGGICLIAIMIVGVIWCVRQRTEKENEKERNRRNGEKHWRLPEVPATGGSRFDNIWGWKDGQYSKAGTRFPSWRSVTTESALPNYRNNVNSFHIPRVRAEDVQERSEDSYRC